MPTTRAEDININYSVKGEGKPLIMIMGYGSGMEGWTAQVPFFSKRFKVVTFDNRGAGKSDKPKGPYTTTMMANDTAHLMENIGITQAHVMGASMGGMIAQELAINHPEKVNRLVLACTYAKPMLYTDGARLTGTPSERMNAVVDLAFTKKLYRFLLGSLAKLRSIPEGSPEAIGIGGRVPLS